MAALAGADHGAVHDDLRQCAFFVCGVFVNKKQTLLKYSNKPPSPRRSHAWWAQGGETVVCIYIYGFCIYREGSYENVFNGHQAVDMYFGDEESLRTFVGCRW